MCERLVGCEPRGGRGARGGFAFRFGEETVEARRCGEASEGALAQPPDEHVPVASFAEHARNPLQFRPQRLELGRGEGAPEEPKGRAQPAHGDPHLMHGLNLVARLQRRKVAEEMRKATVQDRRDRLVERRVRAERHRLGPARLGRRVGHQRVRALRLAPHAEARRKRLDEFEPEPEQRLRRTRLELKLDLSDRRALLAREQDPLVEGDLDRGSVETRSRGPRGGCPSQTSGQAAFRRSGR